MQLEPHDSIPPFIGVSVPETPPCPQPQRLWEWERQTGAKEEKVLKSRDKRNLSRDQYSLLLLEIVK